MTGFQRVLECPGMWAKGILGVLSLHALLLYSGDLSLIREEEVSPIRDVTHSRINSSYREV